MKCRSTNCQLIGYAQRRRSKNSVLPDTNAFSSSVEVDLSWKNTAKRTNYGGTPQSSSRLNEARFNGVSERSANRVYPVSIAPVLQPQSKHLSEKYASNVHVKVVIFFPAKFA